jgi:hypothetical protein
MEKLTLDQVRDALAFIEKSHAAALEGQAYGLAQALWEKREALWIELVGRIQAADPYATESDIRYFEGQ